MHLPDAPCPQRIPLSRSQQNIYHGVLQDGDPYLYLIGRSYRFHPVAKVEFLTALRATILANPIQLCVLTAPPVGDGYPDLVPALDVDDIVDVCADDTRASAGDELAHGWQSSILATPLVRYRVRVDSEGMVRRLDAHAHHVLLDGGAIGIIEADLGRALAGNPPADGGGERLAGLVAAQQRESILVGGSVDRLAAIAQRELGEESLGWAPAHRAADVPASAAKGIRMASEVITGDDFDALCDLAERENVPLNILVAAAATAVYASTRQSTDALLVHAVDNRFGEPELDVATCLVNSVAQPVRFSAVASTADLVRMLDRGYVKAARRRWLREEQYRRMYLAINRTTSVESLTLNFLREPCAPELAPFSAESPVTSAIGPVEGMTVAAVLDERRRTLTVDIWDRADVPAQDAVPAAARIAQALKYMPTLWNLPIAMAVGEWCGLAVDGKPERDWQGPEAGPATVSAWFVSRADAVDECRRRRVHVDSWIARLIEINAAPGDVVVFADDGTDAAVDLMIACHLAGCGYSACDAEDQVRGRADRLGADGDGIATHVVDLDSAHNSRILDREYRRLVDTRVEQTMTDPCLAARTAYVMPTSGSTGEPKLVPVRHGSLAAFCTGVIRAYGWGPDDTILQCAPLTSDISVEEVFGATLCGATLMRSAALRAGDLQALAGDLVTTGASVLDLPTAMWHLWCEDAAAKAALRHSGLRQIVVGGEPIRPGAVEKWINSPGTENISLVSSYGPTETTVVVTILPIIEGTEVVEHGARLRLGRPVVADTVVIAFGEVVVLGDMVADGYLGADSAGFAEIATADGRRLRAYATADRVTFDAEGYPTFAGRKDALVKIAGKRVDTAEIVRRVVADPAIADVAVEVRDGRLGVWFQTQRTRDGHDDPAVAARITNILADSHVPSFIVSAVAGIPRKPNGKTDTAQLCASPGSELVTQITVESEDRAVGLAGMWSARLGRPIGPDASLLAEGIGSLDLVRILPDTRRYLGRQVSILDVISADTAANLVCDIALAHTWMDTDTATEIERDFSVLTTQSPVEVPGPRRSSPRGGERVLVVGASGILGTGFAEALVDLARSGRQLPEVVLAMRSTPTGDGVWSELHRVPGVRLERLVPGFGPDELRTLVRDTGARTVVNCAGNTKVVVPYRELRSANVELATAMADACGAADARLVHLSTHVVNADVAAPQVVDPRQAPYPYAASKALAELAIARAGRDLDFTMVRLPRVLGTPDQVRGSADILVSVIAACHALQAYPAVELTEEVTTGRAAATSILRMLPEFGGPEALGSGIRVMRGQPVSYGELLGGIAGKRVAIDQWQRCLDESDWAKENPRRWSVIDAWMTLGHILGGRTYAQFLAQYPALPLNVRSVGEVAVEPEALHSLLAHGYSGTRTVWPTTYQPDAARQ